MALSDSDGILASPHAIIERREDGGDVRAIVDIIKKNAVGRVVVGLPRSMNGSLGPQVDKVKLFTAALGQATEVPVEYSDERLTTVYAERLAHVAANRRRKQQSKTRRDDQAAGLILQGYLDASREADRPPDGTE